MRLTAAVKQSFVAGLILLAPLVVTVYVLRILAIWSLSFVDPLVQGTQLTQYTANIELVAQLVAVGFILSVVTAVGFAARWSIGRRVFGRVGRVVNIVPLVNVLYASVRQVATALVERDTGYERVVLVEYPRADHFAIGFVTGESPAAVEPVTGEPAFNVFLPNSPNPTGGRLVVLPASQVSELDLSVRQALRLVVTTGMGSDETPAIPNRFPDA
jgi:uncharacterized membrane protein